MKRFSLAQLCGMFALVLFLALVPGRTASAAKPEKVKNFQLAYNSNRSAFLTWDKAKNASYYLLCQYDPETGAYAEIAKTSSCSYEAKQLKVGEIYQFAVQSVYAKKGKTVKAAYSDLLEVEGKRIRLGRVHGRHWAVVTKRKITGKDTKTGKTVHVKKGTAGAATSSSGSAKTTLILENGTRIQVKRKDLKYGNLYLTKSYKYYSQAEAEAFVNQKGYYSPTKWLVWVSQYTASVHVFKGSQGHWKRKLVAECVIGQDGHTVPGVFHMLRHSTTRGKPLVYFSWNPAKEWGLAIHCRIDSNTRGAFSSGCVRLGDSDLYYVINHCPIGTTVVSY